MVEIPPTMRSLVAPRPCSPSDYEIMEMPTPKITKPTEVLIRMRAAAINTSELEMAAGNPLFRLLLGLKWPYKIGLEGAGVVVGVGSAVKDLGIGDEVYGFGIQKPMGPEPAGFASEYAVAEESAFLKKPAHLSFEEAASLPGLAVTAYQALRRGLQFRGEASLDGRTVYVPGALSASGAVGIQVAKEVFGAAKIISTVSTPKMGLVERYLPGLVDELHDYTKEDITAVVPRGSVDVVYNTQWTTLDEGIRLLDPQRGALVSITGVPRPAVLEGFLGPGNLPGWLRLLLGAAQWYYRWKLRGTAIQYEMVSGSPDVREDLEAVGEMLARGQIKAVMRTVDLGHLERLREETVKVATGKGGLGKLVIRID